MSHICDVLALRVATTLAHVITIKNSEEAEETYGRYSEWVGFDAQGQAFYASSTLGVVMVASGFSVSLDDMSYPLSIMTASSSAREVFGVQDAEGHFTPVSTMFEAESVVKTLGEKGGTVMVSTNNGWKPVDTD